MNSLEAQSGLNKNVIHRLTDVFQKYPDIEKVVLYGSRAKGTYKPGSDIDLTLFSPKKDLSLLLKIASEIDDLLLPYKVDLSMYELLDNENLRDHIQRVGLIFYIRQQTTSVKAP